MQPEPGTDGLGLNPRTPRDEVVTRALLRSAATRGLALPPGSWQLIHDPGGKPVIVSNRGQLDLHVSLSHTTGLSACAVACEHEVGVDVEQIRRLDDLDQVVTQLFAPAERDQIEALAPDARLDRFYTFWTLKEAYLKARGLGLALPLDQIWFELGPDAIRLRTDPTIDERPESWRLFSFDPAPDYRAAVAVRGAATVELLSAGDWFRTADPKMW